MLDQPFHYHCAFLTPRVQNGFVHVGLRQLPPVDDIGENYVRIELSVLDTGKV